MCLEFLSRYQNFGFFVLRLGIGAMFIMHGYGKLEGGPQMWEKLGMATSYIGINFAPQAFGLAAALSEFLGGICLILGFMFRPACFFLFCTMVVASAMHLLNGDGIKQASHAIEAGVLFFSLIFIGPGTWSMDEKFGLFKKKSK